MNLENLNCINFLKIHGTTLHKEKPGKIVFTGFEILSVSVNPEG